MESAGQFERLIRMVQETGERMVVSLEKGRDPIVLLPLSVYEHLVQRGSGVASEQVSARASQPVSEPVAPVVRRVEGVAGKPHVQSAHRSAHQMSPSFTPSAATASVSAIEHDDPADVWDGETGEEYDAERIFAAATGIPRGNEAKLTSSFSHHGPSSERLQAPHASVSEGPFVVRHGGGEMGNGGQRLPIRGEALRGEERFSLGMG